MERQWYIATPAGVLGPMEGAAVLALVRTGGARPDAQVCTADDHQWIEMRRVPELAREMAPEDATPGMERQWFVAARSGLLGPMDGAAVVGLVRSGEARPDTQVCSTDERYWIDMRRVPELAREMAQQDGKALAEPYVCAPPPPPGEPWFYNVPFGRAVLLQWLSFGFYFPAWEHEHHSWLRRRSPPQGVRYAGQVLMAAELASAHARVGLPDPGLRLQPVSEGLYALCWITLFLLPIVAVIELQYLVAVQTAAAAVNRQVAPGAAPPPPMGFSEWLAVALGLAVWSFVAVLGWMWVAPFRAS